MVEAREEEMAEALAMLLLAMNPASSWQAIGPARCQPAHPGHLRPDTARASKALVAMSLQVPLAWPRRLALQSLLLVMSAGGAVAAESRPQAAVIFLHGSGMSGKVMQDYLEDVDDGQWLELLAKNGVEVRFPSSPTRPFTMAGGRRMAVWYDRIALSPKAPEVTSTVEASVKQIKKEIDSLKASGIPANRIAVGGFSMGGNIAVQVALRYPESVGAAFALSSYLCDKAAIYQEIEQAVPKVLPPIFMAHGDADGFIALDWSRATANRLQEFGVPVSFVTQRDMDHEIVRGEMKKLQEWLQKEGVLGPIERASSAGKEF